MALGLASPTSCGTGWIALKHRKMEMAEWKNFGLKKELSKFIDCEIIVEKMPPAPV